MNKLKALGLFVMAAASLMAFTASASASNPVLTSTGVKVPVGTVVDSSATGSFLIGILGTVTCTETTRKSEVAVNTFGILLMKNTTISYNGCGSSTVDILATGETEVTSGGTYFAKGERVTFSESGVSCVYGGGTGTDIGTLGSEELVIESELPRQTGSSFLCPAKATIKGKLKTTTPHAIGID